MPQDLIGCRKRRKLKALIPREVVFVNDPSSAERRIDFAVFLIVLWSYGRKICLNMCHENSENSYGCQKRVQIKILPILKLVSFKSLAGNDFAERGTQAEAHCERNLNRQL